MRRHPLPQRWVGGFPQQAQRVVSLFSPEHFRIAQRYICGLHSFRSIRHFNQLAHNGLPPIKPASFPPPGASPYGYPKLILSTPRLAATFSVADPLNARPTLVTIVVFASAIAIHGPIKKPYALLSSSPGNNTTGTRSFPTPLLASTSSL